MPTGWRSEYLRNVSFSIESRVAYPVGLPRVPGSDLEGRPEDLSSYEFRHFELVVVMELTTGQGAKAISGFQRWL